MLLTLDVGNTNTVLGLYRDTELVAHWRLTTARDQTVDEYGILTRELFTLAEIDPAAVTGVIISSVVPPLNPTLEEMSERYFRVKALFIEPGVKTGMPVLYENPQEVGADRIVNSVAAFSKYGGPCIVVDFGTAINFDVVSARGDIWAASSLPASEFRPRRFSPAPRDCSALKSRIRAKLSAQTRCNRYSPGSITDMRTWWTESSNASSASLVKRRAWSRREDKHL